MKAAVRYRYGSPAEIQLAEIEKPTPKADQVLVKVRAAGLNAGDKVMLSGKPFIARLMIGGMFKPSRIQLGSDMAGVVEAVGENVTEFQPGDEVFGDLYDAGGGAIAEYVSVPASALVSKPGNLSFEQAAVIPMAAVTALQAYHKIGGVQAGQKVVVNGASGGVGLYAVQLAKAFGADVTAVCSTRNRELAQNAGADSVIDYTKENFTANGHRYDVIFAANGYHPLGHYQRVMTPTGSYIMTGGESQQMFQAMALGPIKSKQDGQTFGNLMAKPNKQNLEEIKALIEDGKITPVIDHVYALNETADAFRHLVKGPIKGKIAIAISQ